MFRKWNTPTEAASGTVEVALRIPDTADARAIMRGLFLMLTDERNWQVETGISEAAAAQEWEQALNDACNTRACQ